MLLVNELWHAEAVVPPLTQIENDAPPKVCVTKMLEKQTVEKPPGMVMEVADTSVIVLWLTETETEIPVVVTETVAVVVD